MKKSRSKEGVALTEYIILVVLVALAAIAIVGIFSDTLREKFGGAVEEMGGDSSAKDAALETSSQDFLKDLDRDGSGN